MIIDKVVHGGPALSIPAHLSFGQFVIDKLQEACVHDGNAFALINGETGEKTTYKEILQGTISLATGLKSLGVKRGNVIALCSENRVEFIITALASICCGATVTTLNPLYSKDEMTHVLNISRPNTIFCSEAAIKRHLGTIKSASFIERVVQLDGLAAAEGVLEYARVLRPEAGADSYEPADVCGSTDTALILYSSGTTGLPKGVMLTHVNALYSATIFLTDITNNDKKLTLLTIVPWYHAYGLISTINNVLVKKCLVYLVGFNPQLYLKTIQDYKVNVLLAVPPIVVFLAKSPLVNKYDMSSVGIVWCGAAPLTAETITQALKRLPNCKSILQGYGMTETSLAATKDKDDDKTPLKPGSGGYIVNGVKAKVVDIDTRQKLGVNQNGEICIKGPLIMKGYAGNEAATRTMLDEEGYLKTGDIGYYDSDGCFFIVDRLKELIKYKGSQVAPAAVESVVLQHSGVAECGVVGAPDEVAGELPTAFVVLKPQVTLTERELLAFTNTRLTPTSRLHGGVIFVKEIPKNPSGKILRRALKQKLLEIKKSKL